MYATTWVLMHVHARRSSCMSEINTKQAFIHKNIKLPLGQSLISGKYVEITEPFVFMSIF